MKKYLSFFRLRFLMGLQYRAAAIGGIATQFFWGLMTIFVFQAFHRTDPSAFPMTLSQTSSYIWLQQAFLALFATWMMENEIFDAIGSGNVAYELCRPVEIYRMWFARNLATRLSRALLRCMPILVVAAFLPAPYGLSAPASFLDFLFFLLSLASGVLVTVALGMWIYLLSFYTVSPQGLRIFYTAATELFAGMVVPLPFFPEGIRRVMELLPFASMQNVPLRIYGGGMGTEDILRAVLLQVFWLIVLTVSGERACRRAEKKVRIQGG